MIEPWLLHSSSVGWSLFNTPPISVKRANCRPIRRRACGAASRLITTNYNRRKHLFMLFFLRCCFSHHSPINQSLAIISATNSPAAGGCYNSRNDDSISSSAVVAAVGSIDPTIGKLIWRVPANRQLKLRDNFQMFHAFQKLALAMISQR